MWKASMEFENDEVEFQKVQKENKITAYRLVTPDGRGPFSGRLVFRLRNIGPAVLVRDSKLATKLAKAYNLRRLKVSCWGYHVSKANAQLIEVSRFDVASAEWNRFFAKPPSSASISTDLPEVEELVEAADVEVPF